MLAQKRNLMIRNKTKCAELIDAFTELEIIIEDRKKIKETEEMTENVLKEFKEDIEDELKNKLRFCKRLGSI